MPSLLQAHRLTSIDVYLDCGIRVERAEQKIARNSREAGISRLCALFSRGIMRQNFVGQNGKSLTVCDVQTVRASGGLIDCAKRF